jgi:glycerophosphoryl diester phosphodiesterase
MFHDDRPQTRTPPPCHRAPRRVRGAPEHTLAAYRLAIDQGADVIEPDLVLTRDGVLVCRHENEISGTTDVAGRREFETRRTRKTIDGQAVEGWFTEDFTLAELKTLRARERLPQLRVANTAFDGQEEIPSFREVLDLATRASADRARPVGVYPELKHPSYFTGLGQPMVGRCSRRCTTPAGSARTCRSSSSASRRPPCESCAGAHERG